MQPAKLLQDNIWTSFLQHEEEKEEEEKKEGGEEEGVGGRQTRTIIQM